MRTSRLTLMLLLVTPAGAVGQSTNTPEPDIVLDFASQAVRGLPKDAGKTYHIQIVNFNPLCFSPTIQVTYQEESNHPTLAQALFAGSAKPASTAAPSPTNVGTPTPLEQAPGVRPAIWPGDPQRANAAGLVLGARRALDGVELARRRAHEIASTLENMNCGRTWNITTLMSAWEQSRAELIDAMNSYQPAIDGARRALAEAAALPEGRGGALANAIQTLREAADRIEKSTSETAESFGLARQRLDAAMNETTLAHHIDTSRSHTAVKVQVVAQRTDAEGNITRAFDVPLRRRHRVAFTTGIISTAAPSTHYDRVNRTAAPTESGGAEQEYSTFGRQSGGSWDLINPALLVSASIFNLGGGADFYLSGGTTLRNVNNQASLEPLLGVAGGLLDRLFLQIGAHFGRAEDLLITRAGETPGDVEARAVPVSVTRSDAVGTRWNVYFYTGFSIRVN